MSGLLRGHLYGANTHARNVALAHQVYAPGLSYGCFGRGGADGAGCGGFPDALDADGFGEVGAVEGLVFGLVGREGTNLRVRWRSPLAVNAIRSRPVISAGQSN